MSPLAVGPILALLGIVAAFFVLRGRARTRKSMYRTLREQRERDLRKARDRASAARVSAERTANENQAADDAASRAVSDAAAPAGALAPAQPSSTAVVAPPLEVAPPAVARELPAAPAAPSPPPPAPPAAEPATSAATPDPVLPMDEAAKPSWEIVAPRSETAPTGTAAAATSGRAAWELDPNERTIVDARFRKEMEQEQVEGESLAQTLLSYAGLVAALLVILLGIIIMIGSKGPG